MFYSLPNLRAITVDEMEKPQDFTPVVTPPYDKGKEEVIRWGSDINTQHAFISGYEGLSPSVRVTLGDNPPFKMHALIVDYDGRLPEDPAKYVESNDGAGDIRPTYLVETASGNARLIWLMEEPLLYTNETHMRAFMKQLNKRLKLNAWLPGLEVEALTNIVKYYEIGKEWFELKGGTVISKPLAQMWLLKAAEGMRFDDKQVLKYTVPMDVLATEVEARFPGRWTGAFVEGARGVRFWDPSADNETSAVVREEGVFAFTGDQPFMSWKDIFGAAFVEQYESEHYSSIVDETFYDGNLFWVSAEKDKRWLEVNKQDFTQRLRVKGYESKRMKKQTASEVDVIEHNIKETRRVEAALPFLFHKPGLLRYNKKPYLNISTVKATTPAPPCTAGKLVFSDGKKHFPFTYKLLRNMFTEDSDDGSEQLIAFLAWLKYFYVSALEHNPSQGHAIVLAGPADKGKTFLSRYILGPLMGGFEDASDHLVEGDQWTERIIDSPIMGIDDARAASDYKSHLHFSNRLKKYTANANIMYNQKYKRTASLPWFGRIVITCNVDADSLRILPDMDLSNREKISLFKASDTLTVFPENAIQMVAKELPGFARFLVDWEIPEAWVAERRRFGVKHYHHPDLFAESREQGSGTLFELLHSLFETFKKVNPDKESWTGTSSTLYQDLAAVNPEVVKEYKSAKILGMSLAKLSKNGYAIRKYKDAKTRLNMWEIDFDLLEQGGDDSTPEETTDV